MLAKINGQLTFSFNCPKKHAKTKIKIKNSRIRTTSLLLILVGIFLLPSVAYFSDITPEKLTQLTNQERLENNLKPLTANEFLAQAALLKAQAVLDNQTFQHEINGQTFSYWIKQTGYKYLYVGENLAIDFLTSEGVVKAWLNSEAHRKNLLNPSFTEIGLAAVEGEFEGQPTIVVAQIFGTPMPALPGPRIAGDHENNLYLAGELMPSQANHYFFKTAGEYLVPANNFLKSQADKIIVAAYFIFTNPVVAKTFYFTLLLLLSSAYFLGLSCLIKQT